MRLIESEFKALKLKVLDMAELVSMQLENVCQALLSLDRELARSVRKKEKKVDKFDTKIDRRCERIIALHQPVADDLRFVFSTVKVNANLEQMGDLVNSNARKIMDVSGPYEEDFLTEIRLIPLLELTQNIVGHSLQGLFQEDARRSRLVFTMDDDIDEIHEAALPIVATFIQKRPERAADYIQLLLMIKSFEKIADLAVSIAEESIFHLEGVMYRHTSHKAGAVELPTNAN